MTKKIKESNSITSFYLTATNKKPLWKYRAGNHLPLSVKIGGHDIQRTYSLSAGPNVTDTYRISVKKEAQGLVSSYLHDQLQVGDDILAEKPAGDFVLDRSSQRTIVLLSAGVGVTPILSMLYDYVEGKSNVYKDRKVIWVQGTRDEESLAFSGEVEQLQALAGADLTTHIVYSRPKEGRVCPKYRGRINVEMLLQMIPNLTEDMEFYLCGPSAFIADLQNDLEMVGVESSYIHYESF